MRHEVTIIVCFRTCLRGLLIVDGSSKTACQGCKAEVWISPSSREIQAKAKARVLCDLCGRKEITPGSVVAPLLREQAQEIKDTLDNRKRRN
jgi:hypothetical protein